MAQKSTALKSEFTILSWKASAIFIGGSLPLLLFGKAAINSDWVLNLTPVAEARRISADDQALTNIENTDAVYAAESYYNCLAALKELVFDKDSVDELNRRMSGLLLWLSSCRDKGQKTAPLPLMYRSVMLHPSKTRALIKAMICFSLGSFGHNIVFRKRYRSLRR